MAAVFVLVIYQMLNADAFRVAKVEVQGNSLLSRQEIIDALGVIGQSAFSVDKRTAAGKVLALTPVAEADVAISLPDTVKVRIVEHEPRYVWQVGQTNYLVDERGVVLAAAGSAPRLPTLREVGGKVCQPGERVDVGALQAVARLNALWPAGLDKGVAFELGPTGLAAVTDGLRVDLGDGQQLEAKAAALAAIVGEVAADGREISYVNLAYVDRPYIK